MSALPPKADIAECDGDVRFVPKADICNAANSCLFDHLVGPWFALQKNRERSWARRDFVTICEIGSVTANVGTGAMTAFDYIAIGVLIGLGVIAVTAVSGGKFKL